MNINDSNSSQRIPNPDGLNRFLDSLSDSTLFLDEAGHIYAKNKAFERFARSYNIKDSGLFSEKIHTAFHSFNIEDKGQSKTIHQSTIELQGIRHNVYLHPYVFSNFHLLLVSPADSETLLLRVLDCIPARVFWKDRQCKMLGGNQLFLSDCGVTSSDQIFGLDAYDFFPEDEAKAYTDDDLEVMNSGIGKINIEEKQTRSDGNVYWLQTSKIPIRNDQDDVIGVMCSYSDITLQKEYQQQIEEQAKTDQLTGLFNRQALQEYMIRLKNTSPFVAGSLLFLDLDNFKTINDTLGHGVGDDLLKNVSQRLVTLTADYNCIVVRMGGDEFAVLSIFPNSLEFGAAVAKTNTLANSIKQSVVSPFRIGMHHLHLGVSIGITFFDSRYVDWATKFNEADLAMYHAKELGRNNIQSFSKELENKYKRVNQIQSLLRKAIMGNEFYLEVQPQFNSEMNIIGAEALLRWRNDLLGNVSPAEFIPISERSGTILDIGDWVLESAFKIVFDWERKYGVENIPPLAINVSAIQFSQPNYHQKISDLLSKYAIRPQHIHLELTESLLADNSVESFENISELKKLGISLLIDDFGTGYSSLGYLGQMEIDTIKIDRSFVANMFSDRKQMILIEAILALADKMDMDVIAEGIETEDQLKKLLSMGCTRFQGYYFAQPMGIDTYEKFKNPS